MSKSKYVVALSVILTLATLSLAQTKTSSPMSKAAVTAFVNVNVLPMDRERVLEGQTVIVRDGRITEIGSKERIKVPEGAERIDGAGKYLMPGNGRDARTYPTSTGSKGIHRIRTLPVCG